VAAYYPFLLTPLLLHSGHAQIIRRRWWSVGVVAVWAMAAFLLVINPARPLFPVRPTLAFLQKAGVSANVLTRLESVYSVYGARANAFAPIVEALPSNVRILGLVRSDDPEASLWWPFGSRRVVHVIADDSAESLSSKGVRYVVLSSEKAPGVLREPLQSWLARMRGRVVKEIPLRLRASGGEVNWLLVELP
jgi:hypothetical protein